jgi:hypothetical protein
MIIGYAQNEILCLYIDGPTRKLFDIIRIELNIRYMKTMIYNFYNIYIYKMNLSFGFPCFNALSPQSLEDSFSFENMSP